MMHSFWWYIGLFSSCCLIASVFILFLVGFTFNMMSAQIGGWARAIIATYFAGVDVHRKRELSSYQNEIKKPQ